MLFKLRLGASTSRFVCLSVLQTTSRFPNKISKRNFQTRIPNEISKRDFQTRFPNKISKKISTQKISIESSKSSFQTERKLLVIFRGGLQTVIPLLIRGVMAYVHRFWAGTHLIWYALVPMTTARWSPITRYVVFYPDLLAVGGGSRDMYAGIVRQDYTGAHIHSLGWTSPQRLFILRLLRREICQNLKWLVNLCNALPFEFFFILYNLW